MYNISLALYVTQEAALSKASKPKPPGLGNLKKQDFKQLLASTCVSISVVTFFVLSGEVFSVFYLECPIRGSIVCFINSTVL